MTYAAVVTSFDEPPHYQDFPLPAPQQGEELVDVLAVGLHPRVRSGASGRHYSSSGTLPMIPGIDGVARRGDGTLVYFAATDDVIGTMAQQAVLDAQRAIELPAGTDAVAVAAAMNPAMSSWVALRRRVPIQQGQSVLVLGATGNAGTMAVQVAKRLGAAHVVAAGRNPQRLQALHALGADALVSLEGDFDEPLAAAAANVDIVIDYLWGVPTQRSIMALLTARDDRSRALDWVQIGSVAAPTMELPSAALRSANLRIQGVGQGSVSPHAYLSELPSLVAEIHAGTLTIATETYPLSEVTQAWTTPETPGRRRVLIP